MKRYPTQRVDHLRCLVRWMVCHCGGKAFNVARALASPTRNVEVVKAELTARKNGGG